MLNRTPPPRLRGLTVVAVVVDLRVRLDLHGGAVRNLRNPPVHGGGHHQVVVLVDAFEFLSDGQLLVPRLERDLHLPRELAPCGGERRWDEVSVLRSRLQAEFWPAASAEVMRGEFSPDGERERSCAATALGALRGVYFLELNF